MIQRKLVMRFITEVDYLGNEKYKRVNLNIRPQLTDPQLQNLVDRYCEMTQNRLVDTTVVDTHILENPNLIYLIEKESSEEEHIKA